VEPERIGRAGQELAALDPGAVARRFPLVEGAVPLFDDDVKLIVNNTWRPALSVIGAAGLPDAPSAGAVLLDAVSLRLSFRIPPPIDAETARAAATLPIQADLFALRGVPQRPSVSVLMGRDGRDLSAAVSQ
jgi:hypothetical protein